MIQANVYICVSINRKEQSSKQMIISTAVKSMSIVFYVILKTVFRRLILIFLVHFIWIFENNILNVLSICFIYHENRTNKQKKKQSNFTKSFLFLGLVLNLIRKAYIQYASVSKKSLN